MKQTRPSRLFKRCTYEYYTFPCTQCTEYKKCTAKIEQANKEKQQQLEQKRVQQQKLHQQQIFKKRLFAVLLGISLLTSIIFVILYTYAQKEIFSLRETIAELETSAQTFENTSIQSVDTALTSTTEEQFVATETEEISEEAIEVAQLSAYAPSNTYYYDISDEDKLEMAKVVYAEAGAECYEGKVAVAAVILNRYFCGNSKLFDTESIYSVIHKPSQFASIAHVTAEKLDEIPDCMKAVEDACKGWDPTRKLFSEGALYFYNPDGVRGVEAEKRSSIEVLKIGHHNFHYNFDKV